jgi:hypothetical protein
MVGGPSDNGGAGAAWVFTRDGSGAWTQQGNKLAGAGAVGNARQGQSVALSADGNTATVGGNSDNGFAGAAWHFRRSRAGAWFQRGNKLVGSGAIGAAQQGASAALSADGYTAIVGGSNDNGFVGAAWVFGLAGYRIDRSDRRHGGWRDRRDHFRHELLRRHQRAVRRGGGNQRGHGRRQYD